MKDVVFKTHSVEDDLGYLEKKRDPNPRGIIHAPPCKDCRTELLSMATNHPNVFLYRQFAEVYRKKEWPDILRAQFHTFVSPKIKRCFESLHDDFELSPTVLYDEDGDELESPEYSLLTPKNSAEIVLPEVGYNICKTCHGVSHDWDVKLSGPQQFKVTGLPDGCQGFLISGSYKFSQIALAENLTDQIINQSAQLIKVQSPISLV